MKPDLRIADDAPSIDRTLAERGEQYGDFYDQASLELTIKDIFHRHRTWQKLAPDQRAAIDMAAVKFARIMNGNPDHFDSWHDVAGYMELVARRLSK